MTHAEIIKIINNKSGKTWIWFADGDIADFFYLDDKEENIIVNGKYIYSLMSMGEKWGFMTEEMFADRNNAIKYENEMRSYYNRGRNK